MKRQSTTTATTDIALVAAFAALVAACAIAPSIGVGAVPITLQTVGVLLCGAVLGARRGFLAVLLYLLIGIAGLPVFAGGAAGLAPFATPGGGYLVAFPLAAGLVGLVVERLPRRQLALSAPGIFAACVLASVVFVYPFGITGWSWTADTAWWTVARLNLPFVPGDLLKAVVVAVVAAGVHRAFPDLLPRPAATTRAAEPTPAR